MIDNSGQVELKIEQKKPEMQIEEILQEQNLINNGLLHSLSNQLAIHMIILIKICETLKIDLAGLAESIKQAKQAETKKNN